MGRREGQHAWLRTLIAAVGGALGAWGLLVGRQWLFQRLGWPAAEALELGLIAAQGLALGALLGWIERPDFPGLAGFVASLPVPLRLLKLDGWQLALDNTVGILLRFEAHFAAVYLAALILFLVRGGGLAYPRFIGLRYLRFKLITAISVVGVALGVAGLAVALSIMSGFETELRDKIIGSNAHAVLQKRGFDFSEYPGTLAKLAHVDGVAAASPFVFSEVMVRSGPHLSGVFLKGIEPRSVQRVHPLDPEQGSVAALDAEGPPGILIGRGLAETLHVELGDAIEVLTPTGDEGGLSGPLPRSRTFRLVGIFHTGMYEFDSKSVYIHLAEAQDFFGLDGSVTGIALRLTDVERAGPICERVIAALDGYPFYTRTWYDMNRNLFSALKLQKVGMFIVLVIVILVSAFGVVATLVMLVWEKVKEIAILKSMGATGDGVMKVFMVEGITIGLAGTLLGVVLGTATCAALAAWGMELDPEVYYIERLPVALHPLEIFLVAGVALHICFVATIYPSRRAARLTPVAGLRYD